MSGNKIIVLDDPQALYVRAAEEVAHVAGEAICMHGEFSLCLSGGSTPAATYELLATRFLLSVDWKEVHFYWGDERCVPPEDSASNYGMANRTMLSRLAPKPDQVHRIHGELPPEQAARSYEKDLYNLFALAEGDFPRFSLALMGLGDNSHTASLFPHTPSIHETKRLAVAVEVDEPQRHRVSLTAPVFNNPATVLFLVSGEGKAQAVKNIIEGPHDPDQFPAQLISPTNGDLVWLLDKAAARLLS
jgi:6-phosphogluconolactonase